MIPLFLGLIYHNQYLVTPTIAIVILNWNGRSFLEKFLPFVTASVCAGAEVIVADNNSSDDSVSFLRERYPQLRVIEMDKNRGFAGGYNEALRHVDSDYYVLLNSDVEVKPGWLEPMIGLMESDRSIGACQPKILMYADKRSFEYAGAAGGWLDYLGYPFAKGRIFDVCEEDLGQYDRAEPIFWASGLRYSSARGYITKWVVWTPISSPTRKRSISAGAFNWPAIKSIPARNRWSIMSAGVRCPREMNGRCSSIFAITSS